MSKKKIAMYTGKIKGAYKIIQINSLIHASTTAITNGIDKRRLLT